MGKILETIRKERKRTLISAEITSGKAAKHRSQESLFPPYRGVSIIGTLFQVCWEGGASQLKLGQPPDPILLDSSRHKGQELG